MKEYFRISAGKYVPGKSFDVVRPASLNHPKNHAVMFIMHDHITEAAAFTQCEECLIFWPESIAVPEEIEARHAVYRCSWPHTRYCSFYAENAITYYPPVEDFELVNGAFIAKTAKIGNHCSILPGAYIGGEAELGDNCYVGAGTKLVGEVHIGSNVIIRENSVIGADGLSTDRNEKGHALTMPQFGGVVIEDDVQIGALTVIARGAIDNTLIRRGCRIDNSTFISHNVTIGEDTFIVGESIMFGSSSTGDQVFISGNSTIRNGKHIGSVVVSDVAAGAIVKGNPAK